MRFPTFLYRSLLPLAMTMAACSDISADMAGMTDMPAPTHGQACVKIILGTKAVQSSIEECIVFAMNEDGKVVQKDSILQSAGPDKRETQWTMACGNYRIWCVANYGKSSHEALWNCDTAEKILKVAFPIDAQHAGIPLALLTVNGNDGVISLAAGEIRNVQLTGKPLPAKIRLENIINGTSYSTMPALGPVPLKCMEAVLLNVADSMTIADKGVFPLRNDRAKKTLDLTEGCVHAFGSGADLPPGSSRKENLELYCFPNGQYEEGAVLSVRVCLADEYVRWYNIPLGTVNGGHEYTISNLTVLKEGANTPFVLTPTSDFSAQASSCQWEVAVGGGLEGESACGEMKCTLSHTQVFRDKLPTKWSCDFENVYGPSSLSSSNPERVFVTGAGKHWELSAISDGYSTLTLFDGLNSKTVPVCVGPSIRCGWLDCKGGALEPGKTLLTYQCCRLDVSSYFGELYVGLEGSAFEHAGLADEFDLVVMHPGKSKEVVLTDYFETGKFSLPCEIRDWDIMDCPTEVVGEDGTLEAGGLRYTNMTLPFDFNTSSVKPECYVDDPGNKIKKYGIHVISSWNEDRFTVSASTVYGSSAGDLGISIYCKIGDKVRKVMSIDKCNSIIK